MWLGVSNASLPEADDGVTWIAPRCCGAALRRLAALLLLTSVPIPLWADPPAAPPLRIDSVVVTLAQQVDVPAAEAGLISQLAVKPGAWVQRGDLVAQLRDDDLQLLVERSGIQAQIASRQADSDLAEQHARKTTEVARAELARSLESNIKYPKTVSQTELDRQRLLVEQGDLEIQRAEQERVIAQMTRDIRNNEHQTALDQLRLREITAPLPGMVVQVQREVGEWVQPGDTIARIIRLDRLRIEGFLDAHRGRLELLGRTARVVAVAEGDTSDEPLELEGEVVFVSPEIDPISSQVRVWVEVDNPQLRLRPGMTASVTLEAP